jgi:tRNA acetyltransferase TAN1
MVRVKHQQSGRRNYHQNKNSNYFNSKNTIQIDQHGFFVTFASSKESFVRNEIYNLLNRFADDLFGAEFSDEKELETTDLHDLDSALENEKTQLKNSNKKIRRFQIVKSGTKHSLFVTTTLPLISINKLIESIFNTSIQTKEQHSRYIERLLPISFICKAYEDDLRKLIIKNEFVEQILLLIEGNETIWFDVQAKKSNNTQLKSSHLEEIIINDLVSRKSEDLNGKTFKRDYKKPLLHILIHVIKNVILISIVRNYDLYKKYNLASINLATTTTTTTTATTTEQQQTKITFDDDNDDEDDEDEETNE